MKIKVAIAQFSMVKDQKANIEKADKLIEQAAKNKVDLLLLPELFSNLYFCQVEDYENFHLAEERKNSPLLKHFQDVAKKHHIVLPI